MGGRLFGALGHHPSDMGCQFVQHHARLEWNVLRTGIERHDWRFAAIPSRQHALEPAGHEIFHDIDLGLQHDSETGPRPVVQGVAIVDAQSRGRPNQGSPLHPSAP